MSINIPYSESVRIQALIADRKFNDVIRELEKVTKGEVLLALARTISPSIAIEIAQV